MKIKVDGRKVAKAVGKSLRFAAAISASKVTKDILEKLVSENNISKNVFIQIGIYGISGYVGSKAGEYIGEKINGYIELIDLYDNLKSAEEAETEKNESEETPSFSLA